MQKLQSPNSRSASTGVGRGARYCLVACLSLPVSLVHGQSEVTIEVSAESVAERMVGYCPEDSDADAFDFSVVFCPDPRVAYAAPTNIAEAMAHLNGTLSEATKTKLRAYCEQSKDAEFSQRQVDDAGLFLMSWMQRYWNLGSPGGRLTDLFGNLGISDGGAMSGILMDVYCSKNFPQALDAAELLDAVVLTVQRSRVNLP